MSTETKIQPYNLDANIKIAPHLVTFGEINNGIRHPHVETADFPQDDPWSRHMTSVITSLRERGEFVGKEVTEFGVGDARNLIRAGKGITHFTAVDIDEWRLAIGLGNLAHNPLTENTPTEGWDKDAISVLNSWTQEGKRISGVVLACLPQSPDGQNSADRYQEDDPLYEHYQQWNQFGLTLNAAVLTTLRPLVTPETNVLLMLSDRVPAETRERLIESTGWQIDAEYATETPIQQDPDTGTSWVEKFDDGRRFYEKTSTGLFTSIDAETAEARRQQSISSGGGRNELNVYHHLSVYKLSPKSNEVTLFNSKQYA